MLGLKLFYILNKIVNFYSYNKVSCVCTQHETNVLIINIF